MTTRRSTSTDIVCRRGAVLRRKETSVSRYPELAEYKRRSWWLLPPIMYASAFRSQLFLPGRIAQLDDWPSHAASNSEIPTMIGLQREAEPSKALARNYDYVIVGAGSAGCVVARRLVDGTDATVLLLEAGGPG